MDDRRVQMEREELKGMIKKHNIIPGLKGGFSDSFLNLLS
jgi:hypothetical protein